MYLTLYSLDSVYRKDSKSAIRIDMQALVLNMLKREICAKSSQKRSITHAQNLNREPGANPAKNRKFLNVTRKSAIGYRIMQGTSMYTQESKLLQTIKRPTQTVAPKK
jgi:hypothetical protein